jgi:hypothetical protein
MRGRAVVTRVPPSTDKQASRRRIPRPHQDFGIARRRKRACHGWHIDVSFPGLNSSREERRDFSDWRANVMSRGRALLMLFLFSISAKRMHGDYSPVEL